MHERKELIYELGIFVLLIVVIGLFTYSIVHLLSDKNLIAFITYIS
ncbi:MAG: hypothetical protein K0U47_12485 [Epsilonproteobacteria bacterium]|nr:hypothetical protein [Campylobacterota bacterium]